MTDTNRIIEALHREFFAYDADPDAPALTALVALYEADDPEPHTYQSFGDPLPETPAHAAWRIRKPLRDAIKEATRD